MSRPVASIDQGTNTVRLLVVDASVSPPRTLRLEQRIVRLGGGFSQAGKLTDAAMDRAMGALREYGAILKELDCKDVRAVGTGVLRQAPNTPDFLSRVERDAGIRIQIISGEKEAETSVRGALWALGVPADSQTRYLVCDVGGGSTEFALWNAGLVTARISVPIGVVSLTEQFLQGDPPRKEEVTGAAEKLDELFANLGEVGEAIASEKFVLVGCSGTFTTLASLAQGLVEYNPDKITGYELAAVSISRLLGEALAIKAEERLRLWPGLPRGREDVIVGGMILCQAILRRFGRETALISDGSLLEGVLLERLAEL